MVTAQVASALPVSVGLPHRAVQVEEDPVQSAVLANAINPLPGTSIEDFRFFRVINISVSNPRVAWSRIGARTALIHDTAVMLPSDPWA
jgi:hypothetical protein